MIVFVDIACLYHHNHHHQNLVPTILGSTMLVYWISIPCLNAFTGFDCENISKNGQSLTTNGLFCVIPNSVFSQV